MELFSIRIQRTFQLVSTRLQFAHDVFQMIPLCRVQQIHVPRGLHVRSDILFPLPVAVQRRLQIRVDRDDGIASLREVTREQRTKRGFPYASFYVAEYNNPVLHCRINSFVSFRKDSEYCPNIQVFNYMFNILCNYIIIYTNNRLNNA